MATITEIYRYPVKGLTGERLDAARLAAGEGLAGDRIYAIAHGSTQFDPHKPQHLDKRKFLMLMTNERLAAIEARYDAETTMLTLVREGRILSQGSLSDSVGRKILEQFFAAYLEGEVRGTPRIVQAPGHNFFDAPMKCVSLVNHASIRDLERVTRAPVHPLRFRANFYFDGGDPWSELQWPGKELAIGDARIKVICPIPRCAATEVNPDTAMRDLSLLRALNRGFGHVHMGVYGEVTRGGAVAEGDALDLA